MHRYLTGCDLVFLEEEVFREEIVQLFRLDAAKVQVLPVGVDVERMRGQVQSSSLLRKHLGFSGEDRVLLTVNRLAADKGVDKVILALKIIRQENPKIKLIIVGKGYQEREILALIEANGLTEHVRIVQDVREQDLCGYYKISDVYVCAFSYPGSSVSVLEAMAAGLPVVTSAQPWLVAGGNNGIFIPDNQPFTIARAVLTLIKGDLESKGAVSLDIVKNYDWPIIARRAHNVYQRIC